MESVVVMTVRGKQRTVYFGSERADGSFPARLRAPKTGNSIRGTLRANRKGVLRFTPTNPDSLNNL